MFLLGLIYDKDILTIRRRNVNLWIYSYYFNLMAEVKDITLLKRETLT